MSAKILLVDDHRIMRELLHRLIDNLDNMEVIGEAEDCHLALKKARELSPDVIIMDVGMLNRDVIVATRKINKDMPKVKIVALSLIYEKRFVLEMFKAGASAYLLKDEAFEELAETISLVSDNKYYISPSIINKDIKDYICNI
jgi:DNA-binding NarL/FixJ family response regulator